MKAQWEEEQQRWTRRSLHGKRYVDIWVDGVYFTIRADEARQCILAIIGVDEQGHQAFLAIEDGYHESEQSWLEMLPDLKARGSQAWTQAGGG